MESQDKKSLQYYLNQIDVWEKWRDNYKEFVPKFINEAKSGKNWSEWDKDIFYEFFEKSNQQCVSSLKQGYFTKEEQVRIKEKWQEIAPVLKDIANQQKVPLVDHFDSLRKILRQYTKQDRRAATYRLVASLQPYNLCTIVNHDSLNALIFFLNKHTINANFKVSGSWFESSNQVLKFFMDESGISDPFEIITYPWQLLDKFRGNHHKNENDMSEETYSQKQEIIPLLKYKKQIILQGPPGTGKTREAKRIAQILIRPQEIDENLIRHILQKGLVLNSSTNYTEYKIIALNAVNITVGLKDSTKVYKPTYTEIINAYSIKMWEGKQSKGNDPYASAIAKYIYDHLLENKDQFKLIQFHPSYTYEDFVRGIVSKPNEDGEGILYEAENKILIKFAQKALHNYQESKNKTEKITEKDVFEAFIDSIKEEIAQDTEHKYPITDAVYLFSADENRFKYKGDNWVAHQKGLNMKFSELKKIIDAGAKERQDIKKMSDLEELTRQHATYFIKVIEKFYDFEKANPQMSTISKQVELNNYVLIIDEINRANLSSVLGELIYALEYRGESVESMYAVDGANKLTLPPNLYIIGTMNTADRSVGHVDYAIRRRFAFVDVLPKDLSEEDGIVFDSKLFNEVSELFDSNLSPEFEKKDVQLGHSYFIDKSDEGGSMAIRLKYEIKPILFEYVKDGVLIGENIRQKIEALNPSI